MLLVPARTRALRSDIPHRGMTSRMSASIVIAATNAQLLRRVVIERCVRCRRPSARMGHQSYKIRAGDLDGVLETVHADSRWTCVGANPKPTKAELVGQASVRRFFEGIVRRLDIAAFEATEFVVEGNTLTLAM